MSSRSTSPLLSLGTLLLAMLSFQCGAVLAKHFDVAAAQELVPWHPTLGDVDSPQALDEYEAQKKVHKEAWAAKR